MTRIIRYRTHADRADENQRAIEAVFAELRAQPRPVDYQVWRLDDGTFIHIFSADGDATITDLPAFRAFQEGLSARCIEPPARSEAGMIGHHAGRR